MADVLPFHAVLFRPGAPELAQWTSPSVEPLSGFSAKPSSYRLLTAAAAATGPAAQGVLEPDAEEDLLYIDETKGFFVYRQEFRTEGGMEKSRLGLIALLDPDGDTTARVFTALDTEPFGIDRCAEEIAESGLQGRPAIAAVEDLRFELEKLLERGILLREGPDIQLELPQGDRHRLWKVEDGALLAEITAFFRGKDCFLIDGLHAYRALRRSRGDLAPCPLAVFFNLFDFGVSLTAATILLKEIPGFKINEIVLRLNPFFELKTYPFDGPASLPRALTDFREDFRIRGFTDSVVGACFGGVDHFFLFQLREGGERERIFLPDVKAPHREFDSVLLRRGILERCLGIGARDAESVEYCWSVEEAIAAVRAGKFRAAFFLNPPNKRKLLSLARGGFRLPPGSARLEPPVRSRLVLQKCAASFSNGE